MVPLKYNVHACKFTGRSRYKCGSTIVRSSSEPSACFEAGRFVPLPILRFWARAALQKDHSGAAQPDRLPSLWTLEQLVDIVVWRGMDACEKDPFVGRSFPAKKASQLDQHVRNITLALPRPWQLIKKSPCQHPAAKVAGKPSWLGSHFDWEVILIGKSCWMQNGFGKIIWAVSEASCSRIELETNSPPARWVRGKWWQVPVSCQACVWTQLEIQHFDLMQSLNSTSSNHAS